MNGITLDHLDKLYYSIGEVAELLEINASNINRIPHAGCHNSGWYALKLRQIFVFVSNRPDGVRNIMCGGLKGYSAGSFFVPIRWIMMIIISIHSCFSFDFGRFQIKLQSYYSSVNLCNVYHIRKTT